MDDTDALFKGTPTKPKRPDPAPPRTREKKYDRDFERRAAAAAYCIPTATPEERAFRHSHWETRRARVREIIAACGWREQALERFDECGSQCTVEFSKSLNRHRLRANYCHCRHCEPCMRAKGSTIALNLREQLKKRPDGRYRFVTLTLAHTADPLADQIKFLYTSFRKLRSKPVWKKSQVGGCATLEVKHSATGWHVHLHVITEGGWIDQRELSNAWLEVTKTSFITDVRALSDQKTAVHYVTKYIAKGVPPAVWQNADLAQEWVLSTKGTRVANTYGNWRGASLTKPSKDATDWVPVCTLNALINSVMNKEPWAQGVLLSLRPPGASDQPRSRSP